ncbi:MAG: GNAT family N-acetyltransferase [Alphaproteobacteria bacterium]|nr:GNAT family N-acetyltransferase [Alphaproteobacteria bacterium]
MGLLKVLDGAELNAAQPAFAPVPRPAPATAQDCRLVLLSTGKSLLRLEQGWKQLEASSAVAPTAFQSFEWVKAWHEVYGQPDSARELQLLAGYRNDELVFLWPLIKQRRHGLTVLTWATEPIAQYGDLLCHREETASDWINWSIAYLRQQAEVDLLYLRHVRQTSNFAPYAQRHFRDGQLNERAAAMDLSQFKTDADYDARYDSRQRKHRKKARKALEEMGAFAYGPVTDVAAVKSAIAAATREKLAWLEERGKFNTTIACPGHQLFLEKLSRLDASGLHLTLTQISLGEKPISWEFCFAYNGVQYCYMTAHENALTDYSPGRVHFDLAQRHWLAQGQKSYDLMVPYDPYKESWSSALEPVNDYYLPLTAKGSLYGNLVIGWLRPQARGIYMRLPPRVLRVLKKLLRQ